MTQIRMIFNVIHLLLIGFVLVGFTVGDVTVRCREMEKQALLKFKKDLIDDHGILSSWGAENDKKECCNWRGVSCSNKTGHVNVLDLRGIQEDQSEKQLLRGTINSALIELQHLSHLDLSNNDFQLQQIPEFIGSLQGLEILELWNANFSGTVPYQLANLTNLQILDVSLNFHLRVKHLEWLSHLSSLRYLGLNDINLHGVDWLQQIVKIPFLKQLSMANCGLSHTIPYSANFSSTSLSILDLSFNFLTSLSEYSWLFNLSTCLTNLDLSSNKLAGPLPVAFGGMTSLEYLDLSVNQFKGGIPSSFGNISRLSALNMGRNYLDEPLYEILQKLSAGVGKSLYSLVLSTNKLWGPIPDISRFSSLRELDVSDNRLNGSLNGIFGKLLNLGYLELSINKLTGSLPDAKTLGQQLNVIGLHLDNNQFTGVLPDMTPFTYLVELDLSNNQFHGKLPETIGKLSGLEILFVSSNSFEGTITEDHLLNLSRLKSLDLSNNLLSLNLSSKWIPPFQLDIIHLSNCKLGPQFPSWLQNQNSFSELDISSTDISDTLPKWFWGLSSKMDYLNMSYNHITGRLPNLASIIFHDAIHSIDLSNNQLTGELPDCWMNQRNIIILNLANNKFNGHIPSSLGSLYRLESLHLRDNNFTGNIPASLKNYRKLKVMEFEGNKLTGEIPPWIGTHLMSLIILSLRQNKFYGNIPENLFHLNNIHVLDLSGNRITGTIPNGFRNFTSLVEMKSSAVTIVIRFPGSVENDFRSGPDYIDNAVVQWKRQEFEYRNELGLLTSIDLSSNKLTGHIPDEIASLRGLISLNLSRNHLSWNIVEKIDHMGKLEVLDVSYNQLSGEIPRGLASLNFLDVLDLSNNNFSGKIPSSTQLQSFNASSYYGNSKLCGPPLRNCPKDASTLTTSDNSDDQDALSDVKVETLEFYSCIGTGFFFGFWGVVGTLFIKDSWRHAYFNYLDDLIDMIYVVGKLAIVRLLRKFRIYCLEIAKETKFAG
ncbi:hypothetical protein FXO37_25923 [Capsicum annuum]|nr:hypothetical protein FXO37_25923 [Capsicum annuum]